MSSHSVLFLQDEEEECCVSLLVGVILSELGGGGKVQPKAIQLSLKIYPERLTWTLDLSLSLICVP